MIQKERYIVLMVVARMQKILPGLTKDEAAKKLKIGRRTVDTKLLKLLVTILQERNINL
jgi:hypothetical protein